MLDLSFLPEINFAKVDGEDFTDAAVVERLFITGFEAAARMDGIPDWQLFPADHRRLFLLNMAARFVQFYTLLDFAGKQGFLKYAIGEQLDNRGADYGERGTRLPEKAAVCTLRYTLSTVRNVSTLIPSGSRVSVGDVEFATVSDLIIPPETLTGDVDAKCTVPGIVGNGFLAGQITTMVNRFAFVSSVVNTTDTAGGADAEQDDAYRMRIWRAPESFSVAGPAGAYEFWTYTANPGISDVSVWSPEPGHVNVVVLMQGGELPTPTVRSEVLARLNDERIRPLTDFVSVPETRARYYGLDLTYWVPASRATALDNIQRQVKEAVRSWVAWQSAALGRDVNTSELIRLVMEAGAGRVQVNDPVFTPIERDEVAKLDPSVVLDDALDFGGVENG